MPENNMPERQEGIDAQKILKDVNIESAGGADNIFRVSKGGHDLVGQTVAEALAKIQKERGTLKHIIPIPNSSSIGFSLKELVVVVEPHSQK